MAIDDIFRAEIISVVNGIVCNNSFYFKEVTEPTGPTDSETELTGALIEQWQPVWAAALSTEWQMACIRVKLISPDQRPSVENVLGANTGTTGPALPANCVGVISHYSTELNAKGRGRTYISGLAMDDESTNHLTPTGATNLGNIANLLTFPLAKAVPNGSWNNVHWSPTLGFSLDIALVEARSPIKKLRSRTRTLCLV